MLHVFSKLGISLLINIIPYPSWHVIGIIICQSILSGELISVNRSQFNVEPNKAALHHLSRQYLGGILMESHLILKIISSPILVQFWEKIEAKNTVKTVVEQHIVTFGLQGAGIKSPGVNPQTVLYLFNVGVFSTLTYGCASIYINKSQLVNLDKYQVKLIKQCLGLKCLARTTALMKALGIEYISSTVKQSSLDLLKVCLLNNSMMQKFYCMLMNEPTVR